MNPQPTFPRPLPRAAAAALLCLLLHAFAPAQTTQPTPPQQAAEQNGELSLRWDARGAVRRYRLQVARDERFVDIVFDGAVTGLETKVPLAPGKYFWRVAPAPRETGRYTAPRAVEVVKSEPPKPVAPPVMRPVTSVGWQTATGRIDRPVAARLRAGQQPDLVAVNAEGTVFALDGANGSALWTARYRPGRAAAGSAPAAGQSVFTPVMTQRANVEKPAVLVAYEGGVRLLDGETGDEVWRAPLKGRAIAGNAVELNAEAAGAELVVLTDDPSNIYVLDAATGKVAGQGKLDNPPAGPPIPFNEGNDRGVALALGGSQLEVRQADGGRLRPAVRYDVPFATPPLVIAGPRGTIIIVGTEHGLLFLRGDMKPLGRISTEEDSPQGRLAAADLNSDGSPEVVMVTKRGRVVLISGGGKIVWTAQGAGGAYSAAFADLNRDGVLDVLVADDGVFARGFSGLNGALIWQADDEPKSAPAGATGDSLRSLAVMSVGDVPLVVGSDPARGVLRAVGLPQGAVKTAGK
jgi:hypothetical protein